LRGIPHRFRVLASHVVSVWAIVLLVVTTDSAICDVRCALGLLTGSGQRLADASVGIEESPACAGAAATQKEGASQLCHPSPLGIASDAPVVVLTAVAFPLIGCRERHYKSLPHQPLERPPSA
jgi:hypothetical protein